jgi:hypothetical protein
MISNQTILKMKGKSRVADRVDKEKSNSQTEGIFNMKNQRYLEVLERVSRTFSLLRAQKITLEAVAATLNLVASLARDL